MTRMLSLRRALAGALLIVATLAPTARADVVPGDKIGPQNIDKVKDLISPGMEWCIKHGFPITIAETKRVDCFFKYTATTEKYASQVKLSPDGLRVQNYVAGLPFPNI